ncbi:unnamed protein product [Cylicocyclus nassatus]|uniref:Protein kinase domain-containing protein n=1 Tax=Cylicocyclus nassatus TaxID=53992 RepID=A0AA36M6P1_CYLNA|nr:unnamed protein product [Cylicocyclus nassatus]
MTNGRQGTALDSKDNDNPFQFQSFKELKRAFQEQMARSRKHRGDESDFSAAVRESNDRRAAELVSSTFYYWSSLLDSSNVDCVLTQEKQCVLIDSTPSMYSGRERARFTLCVKNGTIAYHSIKCAANELIVTNLAKKLYKFIAEEGLQPVQRQYVYREDQLGPPVENLEFPFDGIFEVGKVKRRQIRFPSNKGILAMAIVVANLKPEERNVIINDLCTYKDFGCLNTQRLWGSIVTTSQITILLENSAIQSLASYVSAEQRSNAELLKFARQIATAADYFERAKFVHKKLSLDVCLLTADNTVKVVVFGLSTGLFPKRVYLTDVDRCRWIPWECLNSKDGTKPEPYDCKAVIWTLATILWSMFHHAAIPFENETVNEIRGREYRKTCELDIIGDLLPKGMLEILQSCWSERDKRPSSRNVLKAIKKLEQ